MHVICCIANDILVYCIPYIRSTILKLENQMDEHIDQYNPENSLKFLLTCLGRADLPLSFVLDDAEPKYQYPININNIISTLHTHVHQKMIKCRRNKL